MTRLLDAPESFAEQALQGFCAIHARLVRPTPGGVLRATATPVGKVALVIGGGSGHYPAFAGYVGPRLRRWRRGWRCLRVALDAPRS